MKNTVKNYYKMPLPEVEAYIRQIRFWLVRNCGGEDFPHVWWALEVAIDAQKFHKSDPDYWEKLVVECLT